jgi:hypothetical protein
MVALTQHMAALPQLFVTLLNRLFEMLIFNGNANYWQLARPILSLILADE